MFMDQILDRFFCPVFSYKFYQFVIIFDFIICKCQDDAALMVSGNMGIMFGVCPKTTHAERDVAFLPIHAMLARP